MVPGSLLEMVGKQRINCNFGGRCRIGFRDESLHAIRIGDKGQRRVSRYQVSADALPSKPLLRNRRYGPSIEESIGWRKHPECVRCKLGENEYRCQMTSIQSTEIIDRLRVAHLGDSELASVFT